MKEIKDLGWPCDSPPLIERGFWRATQKGKTNDRREGPTRHRSRAEEHNGRSQVPESVVEFRTPAHTTFFRVRYKETDHLKLLPSVSI